MLHEQRKTGKLHRRGKAKTAALICRFVCYLLPFCLLLFAVSGCSRRPTVTSQDESEKTPSQPISTQMQAPTVKVVDPKGKWTFEAHSKTGTLESKDGPYSMKQADAKYQEKGQPPVFMHADQIEVDRGAQRVTLIGAVKIRSQIAVVEGERITYDLKTGKVKATAPTKWTLTPKR